MVAKLLNTILVMILFLLSLLIVVRMIRTDEGFQNQDIQQPKEELYDLEPFFKNYPIQKICDIYAKGLPTIVNGFLFSESGEKIPESVANLAAQDYLKKTSIGGIVDCPFSLPTKKTLSTSYEFVMKLNENLLVKAMSTLIFFSSNLQLTVDSSKQQLKGIEGFLSECSADEIENREFVPLQCIPAESMKATEQAEINGVDKFEMEQRVSQKAQIAKRLGNLVKNLQAFQKEFGESSKIQVEMLTPKVNKAQAEYNFWANPSESTKAFNDEEKIAKKKQDWKSELDKSKNSLQTAIANSRFAVLPMIQLVETYTTLEKQVKSVAAEFEKGIPGAPKS
jgi:hypothetical protein